MSTGYQPWFERCPELFGEQADILKSAGFELDSDALKEERRVLFKGKSRSDPQRQLIVAFPNAFPSAAPKIFDTQESKLLLRHHRFDNRQLCLFGFNENRWDESKSVADALAEAEELILQFKDTGTPLGQEAHSPEPITSALPYIKHSAILVPPPISTFGDFGKLKSQSGKLLGKYLYTGDRNKESSGYGLIWQATFGNQTLRCGPPFLAYLGNKANDISGEWIFMESNPTHNELREALHKSLRRQMASRHSSEYWISLIFNEESGQAGQRRRPWLVARAFPQGRFDLIRTFPYIQEERRPRIPGMEGLETKRITLVGCGSLGSKIAANLAATGVSRFHLIDYDYFEPGNSVRHELGVEHFGRNKAVALLNRLTSLNPAVATNSHPFEFQVASIMPFDAEIRFNQFVQDSDMVIDATAAYSVSHFINRLAFKTRVPALFASVTNGAWGGEIVRVVPGKTPCWGCWTDEYYYTKPSMAPETAGEVFAPGCDQPTFTGTTYEVGFVANLVTAMAVDTLLQRGEFADYSKNYIRWSGQDTEGRTVFRTEILPTHSTEGCPFRDS